MLRQILLALAAALSLSPPAVADGESVETLAGTSWRLTQLDGEPVAPAVTATLVISADNIGGNGGCNDYGGDIAETPGH